jgi:hypothetical protein
MQIIISKAVLGPVCWMLSKRVTSQCYFHILYLSFPKTAKQAIFFASLDNVLYHPSGIETVDYRGISSRGMQ